MKFGIIVSVVLTASYVALPAQAADCAGDVTSRDRVAAFYASFSDTIDEKGLQALMTDPLAAACWFTKDLHTVRAVRLQPSQLQDFRYRPILAIRGLRFVTACKGFTAGLRRPAVVSGSDDRWSLLLGDGIHRVPFFRTWMSRDVVYVAPIDVQTQIIDAWRSWFAQKAASFQFARCEHIDDWY